MDTGVAASTASDTIVLANARLVLEDGVVTGRLVVENGRIVEIEEGGSVPAGAQDCGGDIVMPGLIDLHTDHFEKHIFPRTHVRWDALTAALSHDAQVIGGGITTVFDSLCVGTAWRNPERRKILMPMIEALERAEAGGMLRAEHLVHLRCEVIDPATPDLARQAIGRPIVRIASVMDHTPGGRQSRDVEAYIKRNIEGTGRTREVIEAEMREAIASSTAVADVIRREVVELVHAHGLPLMSHDDTTVDHVEESIRDRAAIAEFPTTLEAARASRARGMTVVAGAPNYLRGGSQSGNVAVKDLLTEGLVDILASDYVPRSMLDAVFRIAEDPDIAADLPAAVAMATAHPAQAAGLADRGRLAEGLRADLLHVRLTDGHPVVLAAWRTGRRVA